MIRHIVLIKFRPEVSDATIATLFANLATLREALPGMGAYTAGKSVSPEMLERGYLHGFTIDFSDMTALTAYLDHPDHKAFGGQLVAHAQGGIDGILVVDLPA